MKVKTKTSVLLEYSVDIKIEIKMRCKNAIAFMSLDVAHSLILTLFHKPSIY